MHVAIWIFRGRALMATGSRVDVSKMLYMGVHFFLL